jgi:hypothetical protein
MSSACAVLKQVKDMEKKKEVGLWCFGFPDADSDKVPV